MKVSVQTDNFKMFKEAVGSNCDGVRFGSEFCEWKIPSLKVLKAAYTLVNDVGKEFTYVTPRVSDSALERVRCQLAFLEGENKVRVVINDLGVLNILEKYPNLKPHLGRQLVFIPARCPWREITDYQVGFLEKRRVAKIFYQTSLNYTPTTQFFQNHGIQDVDIDYIPRCFSHAESLLNKGLKLYIHLYQVPVAITRRCHMARFLGEKKPESCSHPCDKQAFLLKHKILRGELYLHGNVVFRLKNPSKRDFKKLDRNKVEFVVSMNPITKLDSQQEINVFMQRLKHF